MKGHRYACTRGLFCCGIFGLVPLVLSTTRRIETGDVQSPQGYRALLISAGRFTFASMMLKVLRRGAGRFHSCLTCFVATKACWGRDVPATASAYALSGHSAIGYFTEDNKRM
jgi:hypothetical protein